MSKRKKGISADEKKSLILEIFHQSKDFYQLKDVEKIAVKDKGLREQVVKEILQNLVDEGQVETDKIGSSQYYWSFPAKKRKLKQQAFEQLKQEVEQSNDKIAELQKRIGTIKESQGESSRSSEIFEKLNTLKEKQKQLSSKLDKAKLEQSDQNSVEKMNRNLPDLHDAANRWTDNLFSIKSWCKNRFNIQESLIDKQFQIPSDLDYLE
ncbi:AAEL012899-PA [Aedes aegypti]|uniref:Meiotic nuclear division protein 1 homolog n=2 Tax=Aedes aegypti TaxID=7159 RepID=Q16KR8_AEDAE|nr:meiotic nuclear division protein 1 homolog [Aedes aegypti]XP_021702222.1 meiotic nuclear division protein 1 homolog [Aedes aegypti]XP_021702223.1 meiotic nuclear division protein 1 homolog [Aedes aegypti]XP_021702224.1 meiotic nuclear division protein 1 homolog [Aedes aegypti]EAT34900.1 AAEL012899-PA [Aedes aegypti]